MDWVVRDFDEDERGIVLPTPASFPVAFRSSGCVLAGSLHGSKTSSPAPILGPLCGGTGKYGAAELPEVSKRS